MPVVGVACGAIVAALFAYLLRRRDDVTAYHHIDETPRPLRHREGGV